MRARWEALTRWVRRWSLLNVGAGPWVTAASHAVVTVLGLVPYPFGIVGIAAYALGQGPWLWLITSGWALVWYWRREWRQNRLKRKPQRPSNLLPRTWAERHDAWLDVAFPTVAYGSQWAVLVWWLL